MNFLFCCVKTVKDCAILFRPSETILYWKQFQTCGTESFYSPCEWHPVCSSKNSFQKRCNDVESMSELKNSRKQQKPLHIMAVY